MAQIVFNYVGGKPPMFDGTSYDHWKRKMKMHLSTMHKKVWEVTEKDYVILDEENQSPKDQENEQCNSMALNTLYNALDTKVFEQIKGK